MPGWFDLDSLDIDDYKEDVFGIEESIRYVESLIDDQINKGIPSDRIIVGGFSQGMSIIPCSVVSKILSLSRIVRQRVQEVRCLSALSLHRKKSLQAAFASVGMIVDFCFCVCAYFIFLLLYILSWFGIRGCVYYHCSRFRAMSKGFSEFANEANKSTPILMCHGDADQVVREKYAQSTFKSLQELGTRELRSTHKGVK